MSFAKAGQLLELANMAAAQHQGVTLADVAERFGVVYRTAQRMMDALEIQFPDVESFLDDEGHKRWRLPRAQLRDLMDVTASEIAMLDLAITDLERSGHDVGPLRTLKDKVLSLVPRKQVARLETDHDALLEAQGFVARPGPRPRVDRHAAETLAEAIKGCRLVEFLYRSQRDDKMRLRRVAPYGLLSGLRRYLVGQPVEDPIGPVRSYRLDQVQNIVLCAENFVRPAGFDLLSFSKRAFGVYEREAEYGEVVWRFVPAAADHARGYLFHPDQTVEDAVDGSLIVRFWASGHLEMCWHLYAWGDKVEVIAPQRLRDLVEGFRRSDFSAMP